MYFERWQSQVSSKRPFLSPSVLFFPYTIACPFLSLIDLSCSNSLSFLAHWSFLTSFLNNLIARFLSVRPSKQLSMNTRPASPLNKVLILRNRLWRDFSVHVASGCPDPQTFQHRQTLRNFRNLRATGFSVSSSLRTGLRNTVHHFFHSLRPCGKSSS